LICLFGGTFDPVHHGHIHGAATVCAAFGLAEIRMVLSAQPGHRESPAATPEQRWQMLRLACAQDPRLVADDRELKRAAPSYTVDTLIDLRAEIGDAVLVWVLGSDAFADLPSWHRWAEVLELTNLAILRRPGETFTQQGSHSTELDSVCARHRVDHSPNTPFGQIRFLEDDMQAISASEVRATLAAGRSAAHLIPAQVATYITQHGLYGVLRDP
jgi:nicotinate-nucleotide adenylyltransferase